MTRLALLLALGLASAPAAAQGTIRGMRIHHRFTNQMPESRRLKSTRTSATDRPFTAGGALYYVTILADRDEALERLSAFAVTTNPSAHIAITMLAESVRTTAHTSRAVSRWARACG